jgi:hypothetical protein
MEKTTLMEYSFETLEMTCLEGLYKTRYTFWRKLHIEMWNYIGLHKNEVWVCVRKIFCNHKFPKSLYLKIYRFCVFKSFVKLSVFYLFLLLLKECIQTHTSICTVSYLQLWDSTCGFSRIERRRGVYSRWDQKSFMITRVASSCVRFPSPFFCDLFAPSLTHRRADVERSSSWVLSTTLGVLVLIHQFLCRGSRWWATRSGRPPSGTWSSLCSRRSNGTSPASPPSLSSNSSFLLLPPARYQQQLGRGGGSHGELGVLPQWPRSCASRTRWWRSGTSSARWRWWTRRRPWVGVRADERHSVDDGLDHSECRSRSATWKRHCAS